MVNSGGKGPIRRRTNYHAFWPGPGPGLTWPPSGVCEPGRVPDGGPAGGGVPGAGRGPRPAPGLLRARPPPPHGAQPPPPSLRLSSYPPFFRHSSYPPSLPPSLLLLSPLSPSIARSRSLTHIGPTNPRPPRSYLPLSAPWPAVPPSLPILSYPLTSLSPHSSLSLIILLSLLSLSLSLSRSLSLSLSPSTKI